MCQHLRRRTLPKLWLESCILQSVKKAAITLLLACVAAQAQLHIRKIDDHVYQGRQPRPEDYKELAKMGIKTVIDLRGGAIHKPHERKEVEAAGMQYFSMRLSGLFEPHQQQMETILSMMEDPSKGPVFVHCRRGDDRTGTVIACYRIEHDHWSNKRALAEANRNGLSHLEILMRRYIRDFKPHPEMNVARTAPR